MVHGLRILAVQLRASLLLTLQYRLDFFLQSALGLFWSAIALVPLWVLFSQRSGVAGWNAAEALVVVAFFLILKGLLSGVIQPSVVLAVEQIRTGSLDLLLLKPADAQLLITTARWELARLADALAGLALLAVALARADAPLSLAGVAGAAVLFAGGVAVLYSLFVLVLSLAFVFVKIDNLSFLLSSIFDAARWPSSVFRGAFSILFTFVLPLALMTTYPAMALLGRIDWTRTAGGLVTAGLFLLLSRWAFRAAIGRYTSAGG
ncbi:MAG TPA: ABC-2 family transporter protein [Thermoanaerobaculia bacterium]|nr:ABC-2 family transporter protein [Thermoanaerobaculia bacterium]